MIRHTLQSGGNIREKHARRRTALPLGEPLNVGLLQLLLLGVHLLLQPDHILHMALIAPGKHINGIPDQPVHHLHHLRQLPLGVLTDLNPLLPALLCRIRHILRMVPDTLNIIDHMEQSADTL